VLEICDKPILTGVVGNNADLLPKVFELYIPEGSVVADVTYGRGVFWRDIDQSKYRVLVSDILTGVDFRCLGYIDESIDALILDPPYMHGGATVKESINECYRNQNTSHESIIRLYAGGIIEAARVLRQGGKILVKCQDEIESGKQRLSHVEILQLLELFGFRVLDLFVLLQESIPAMRERYQKSARKNHSYLIVGEFRR
jgi:hypothetical protein